MTWADTTIAITSVVGTTALVLTLVFLLVSQFGQRKQLKLLQQETKWSLRPWYRLVRVDFFEAGEAVSTRGVEAGGMDVRDEARFLFDLSNVGRTPAMDSTFEISVSHGDDLIAQLKPTAKSTIVPGDELRIAVQESDKTPGEGELRLRGSVAYRGTSGEELHRLSFEATFDCERRVVSGFRVTAAT